MEVSNFTCSYCKNSQHSSLFCTIIRNAKQRCAVFNASTSYYHSTAPTWVWKWLCGRPAAVRSADTTDHFQKLVSGSPLTGNLDAWSSYCIFFCYWYLISKAWAIIKILLSWRRLLFKLHSVLLSDSIYSLTLMLFRCISGKRQWAVLPCLSLPASAEPLISTTRLIQCTFKEQPFLASVVETLVAAVAVLGNGGGPQEGQFNLKCLSLVYQLLRFKRPGQLELSDFCHFDLFLFFSCNVYFNARPPAVCVQRRCRQKQLEGRHRYH